MGKMVEEYRDVARGRSLLAAVMVLIGCVAVVVHVGMVILDALSFVNADSLVLRVLSGVMICCGLSIEFLLAPVKDKRSCALAAAIAEQSAQAAAPAA